MKKKPLKIKHRQQTNRQLLAGAAVLLGLAGLLYAWNASTDPRRETPPTASHTEEVAPSRPCDEAPNEKMKSACLAFVSQWCGLLKANGRLPEEQTTASQDLGYRLPVMQKNLDPFDPADCYRQWWLTEADFFRQTTSNTQAPAHNTPSPFSEYQHFAELSPLYFAHKDASGELRFPEKYEIEKKFSHRDQELLKRTLRAAYKYADVNAAIRDGYAAAPIFIRDMGIHFINTPLVDDTLDIDKPEFLIYIKTRPNNS